MAEILSPGVFVEEVPSSAQVVQGVSTSNMGIIGYTKRGPADKATLVTSFEQFTRKFGDLVKESFLPMSVAAFFANGGKRGYVVRVVPGDATAANCKIQSKTTDQTIETGDGVLAIFSKTLSTSLLKDNGGASPLVPSSVSFRWRAAGTPVVSALAKLRNGTTDALFITAQANYEGRIATAALPAYDSGLESVVRGSVTIEQTVAAGSPASPILVAFPGASRIETVTVGVSPDTTTATFDHQTGIFSIKNTGTNIPAVGDVGALKGPKVSFTPATATVTISDNGAGVFPIGSGPYLAAPGAISYTDGSYSFTTTVGFKPHLGSPVLASYKINAWDLNPISKGTWGNDLKVQVAGNVDYFDALTATYSRFNLNILLLNTATLNYDVAESYEELDFATTTSAQYFPDVVNELSDLITVTEPGGNEAPGELTGVPHVMVVAGGNELVTNQTLAITLSGNPLAPRSVVLTFTDSTGVARTVKDNGTGKMAGDIDADPANLNAIVYTSGTINVKLGYLVKGGTLVRVAYRSATEETTHTESFGDTAKGYTVGTDGTFDDVNYGINQFTAVGLKAPSKGLYALNKVDELMQVVIPDFAGDKTVTGQLIDYAEERAGLPSGGDRFIILTVPKGSDPQEAVDWFRHDLGRQSMWAALYWPWVKVADPLSNNRPLLMPPLGHVAGVYARTDNNRNVGKSPGGTVDGALRFLLGLEYESTQGERDLVYPNKINPLVTGVQTGLAVWGVRTISPTSEWRYINARRLFMFLEKSIFESTHWIVFENNGPGLWTRIKAQVEGFLKSLFNENYFAGNSPAQAFFVIVDDTNNPPESINNGQVIIDVGIAPNKPAEFVRFRFQQKTSQ